MTCLRELSIHHVRNIKELHIQPSPAINVIQGNNGAGKTSLLEAINILSTLHSFRTPKIQQVITHHKNSLIVRGIINDDGTEIPVGIKKSRDSVHAKLNHQKINSISNISKVLPVLSMHPTSFTLLTGEPGLRRSFLDWGCFHFYPEFNDHWKKYNRVLAQRNAALRQHLPLSDIRIWDQQLATHAAIINTNRYDYLNDLKNYIDQIIETIQQDNIISLFYRSGWPSDKTLIEVLHDQIDRDRRSCFTWSGPHRADLIIKTNNYKVNDVASRGQLKLITLILTLSQALHFNEKKGLSCILLLDDLPSEFDEKRLLKIIKMVSKLETQTFITLVDVNLYPSIGRYVSKLFHVKQGSLIDL